MRIFRTSLLLTAGISMLAIAACGEEETIVSQVEPPANVEEQTTPPPANDEGEATRKLREGANSLLEGAGELTRDARERAERALEDAGPALDRAGEIAGQIGASLNEIARRAMQDFDKGVALLEQRITEATGDREPVTGDPAAVLAPADQLNADTRAAARAGPAGVGPDYVGVWASDAASCAKIDQEPLEIMAVITPTTIRRYESVCNFPATEMTDGKATLAASCVAEGDMEERSIMLDMPTQDTITIGQTGSSGGAEFVRCHLPAE
ncbi:hypothetical protein [Mesorhizobium sp. CAU 1732]|uniref:hypothetical protein n=1 Tax=Mesorhizobium sp. CAU 1732 TaxID=3140358 RepID=UPI003261AA64